MADHDSEATAVKYYLNQEVQFDLQAAALECPSDKAIDRAARGLLLDADPTAPTELPSHLQTQFDNDTEILELADKNMELWEAMQMLGFRTVLSAKGKTPLYEEKMAVSRELSRQKAMLRQTLMEQARREHFRNAPTERLNAFLDGTGEGGNTPLPQPQQPPMLLIDERRQLVELIRQRTSHLSEDEIHKRRCLSMNLWVGLQGRTEAQRRGMQKKRHLQAPNSPRDCQETGTVQKGVLLPKPAKFAVVIPVRRAVPIKLHELQCPFCNADPGADHKAQSKIWDRANKLWDHVEKNVVNSDGKCAGVHQNELQAYSGGTKTCGLCARQNIHFVPKDVEDYKRHTYDIHGSRLRGLDRRKAG